MFSCVLPMDIAGECLVKRCCLLVVLCCCALPAFGLAGGMERAIVHVMRKVPCEDSGQGLPPGMAAQPMAAAGEGSCLEYELRTKKVSYVIRPHKQVLLMVGEEVMIRLAINDLIVSSPWLPKDVRCSVHSMMLLTEAEREERRERERPVIVRCYEDGQPTPCPR
jgi:hypothetical protein